MLPQSPNADLGCPATRRLCWLAQRALGLGEWAQHRVRHRHLKPPRAPRLSHWTPLHSTKAAPSAGTRRVVDGRTTSTMSPTTNALNPTWMPLVTRRSQSLCPPCTARLSWFWAVAEKMLDGWDLGEGGRKAAGHAPSWCTAYLLRQWRVASLPTNALAIVDGSPSPMPMDGGTFFPGRR
jgi:hypothetical protein